MKKALSIVLSLIMAFSAFSVMPFSAFALDSSGQCGNGVYWNFDSESGALTLSGTGDTWDYTFDHLADPECDSPFYVNRDIKNIIVESGVTGLGNNLFECCFNVESISLPEGLTKIGESALNSFNKIESVTLPSSVRHIGAYAFSNWQKLKSITIPDGVTSIEPNTFLYCYGLKYVIIPKSVTSVGESAFSNCGSLTDVYYYGSEADRSNMTISSSDNRRFTGATWHYNEWPAELLKTGDTFEMGMYPQTKVTDDATLTALGAIDCTMTNYGYMRNANADSHTFDAVGMTYADIAYNGEVYRKVTINEYRPNYTSGSSSNQSDNGYTTGNTYYFKWEPIVWQVLAKESDGVYVMSKTLLDAQAYNNYYEDTTWENCSLRTWLNDGFYAAAFSKNEQGKIVSITHSNENSPFNDYVSGGNDTTDKLWVLSYSNAKNDAYGFNTDQGTAYDARKAQGTDYAKSQGIHVAANGNSEWWLRSPGNYAHFACNVNNNGNSDIVNSVDYTNLGIRPAFKVKLDSTVGKSDPKIITVNPNLELSAPAVNVGEDLVITATLPADVTEQVKFTVDGTEYSVDVANGTAVLTLSDLAAKNYDVKAEYPGDNKYSPDTVELFATVKKITSVISVSATNCTVGGSTKITVNYPDDADEDVTTNPHASTLVTICLDGQNIDSMVGVNGVLTYDLDIDKPGTHTVKAVFNGDGKYTSDEETTTFIAKGEASLLSTGDTFEMGMYPQTKVTDSETITALAAIDCTMTGYGYMANSNADNHTFDAVDMSYADIAYNGEVYRKVTINQYRPNYTSGSSSHQSDNGYTIDNTYYFKWEPIVWQVLAKESDGVYVMSKTLLDSQAYNNYYEGTTWENCSLRTWLNDDFYAAAFSENEQAKIVSITHDNEDSPYDTSVSGGNDTTDKLWVLSYSDAKNDAYGFNTNPKTADDARKAQGTDYAKSQGISVYSSNSDWWLRSPGNSAYNACLVGYNGDFGFLYYGVDNTDVGIRPAFKLDLDSTVGKSDPKEINKPIKISNYDELKAFASAVNSGQTGLNAVLTADIVATDKKWTPIGNPDNRYTGVFDGDGHTITGLSNKDASETPKYAGLFGYVGENGVVERVGVRDGNINGVNCVGGIAGYNVGTVQNCYNTGAVTVNGTNACAGGIAGSNRGTVQNCYNTGAVTGSGTNPRAGGIAGENSGAVKNCYNTGTVSGSDIGNCYVGGIVGNNADTYKKGTVISDCYNTGAVTGSGTSARVGGIVGFSLTSDGGSTVISGCYNTGAVTGNGSNARIGGLLGNATASGIGGTSIVKNCCYDRSVVIIPGATDDNNWNAIGSNSSTTVTNVTGLTTAEMTGTRALDNMGFVYGPGETIPWLVKADSADETDGKYCLYYPHLKGFKYDVTGDAADWPAKAEASVTWKEPESYKYTGSEIKPTVTAITAGGKALDSSEYTVSYYKELNDSWSTNAVNPVDAGDYKAVITFTADGHANIEKAFTIRPKAVTISAKSEEFTYDGTAHSCSLYDVEGLVGSDAISAIVEGSITFPGESPVNNVVKSYEFTSGTAGNYTVTKTNGTLTMRKASVPVTIASASQAWTYDGKAHSNNTVTVTNGSLFEGDTLTATAIGSVTNLADTVTGNNSIAPGYKIMHGTTDVTDNYVITPVNGTLTIKPAAITITAEDKESNHGTDLLALTYKIGGNYVDGDELGITLNADIDNTKPGAYTITPSWNNNSNYTATLVDGTYTVGDDPHYYGTEGDERFTCTVCGAVDDTLKAEAEAADKDAADTAAANAVTEIINALPEKEDITTADEAAIKKAREAYDSLTDDQKAKVAPETVNKLTDAEKALAEEKDEEATAAKEKAKAEFIAGVDGTSTESSVIVKWGKVPNAKRYVIYAAYCDKNHKYKYRKIKTVSGKVTKYEIKKLYGKKLNPKKNVKVYIVAQKKKNGKWKKIFKTPTFHIAGAQSKCSNVKKITVKKAKFSLAVGKTAKIKAKLVLVDRNKKAVDHVRKLRFRSTNSAVVKVTKSGKIKAVGKGKATVFVYSNNGTAKAIKVTVK